MSNAIFLDVDGVVNIGKSKGYDIKKGRPKKHCYYFKFRNSSRKKLTKQ